LRYLFDSVYEQVERLAAAEFADPHPEIRRPPQESGAIYAVPCFRYAKGRGTNPVKLAEEVTGKWNQGVTGDSIFERFEAERGYVNVFVKQDMLLAGIAADIIKAGESYGNHPDSGRTVVVDYCSPNIAKPLSVGHLRSTIIGQALINILRAAGEKTVGINFLSDWGTQFGKLLYAYERWGQEEAFKSDPVRHLVELYVRFHKELEAHPELEGEGRAAFKRLEQGKDKERELWKRFRVESLADFEGTVARLGVHFDHNWFESEFEGKAHDLIDRLLDEGIAERSEGAVIIRTSEDEDKPPLVARKQDGTTLYASRDLASAIERLERFAPVSKLVYVVATEQNLHFANLSKALERLGHKAILEHIRFGMVSLPSGKISTREGRVVYLDELLDEAERRAQEIIREKNPQMAGEKRKEVARMVGIGAVIYADLSQDRIKDIVFDWSKMLAFDGNSGPYLQYAAVRCAKILEKAEPEERTPLEDLKEGEVAEIAGEITEPESVELLMQLGRFPQAVIEAGERYSPHVIAGYLYDLATTFSRFYTQVPVLRSEGKTRTARLFLTQATGNVLRRGLALLGIETPDEM
jgi:arginyl-tRNA synthetase